MSNQDREIERLKRIRDQQIQARNPEKKKQKISGRVSQQYRARQKYTASTALNDMPHKWRGLFGGAFLGIIIWILLIIFVEASWADIAGLLAAVLLPMLGFLFGASFDWRDNLRDF